MSPYFVKYRYNKIYQGTNKNYVLVSGHAVGEKGERRTRHNNSTARALFSITKEEEDQKKNSKRRRNLGRKTTGADAF